MVEPLHDGAVKAMARAIRSYVAEIQVRTNGEADVDAMFHANEFATDALSALLAYLPTVGWRLVLVEQIRELIRAANHCDDTICANSSSEHCVCEPALTAMLSAAPAFGGDDGR